MTSHYFALLRFCKPCAWSWYRLEVPFYNNTVLRSRSLLVMFVLLATLELEFYITFSTGCINVTLSHVIVWPGAILLHIIWWFVNYSYGFGVWFPGTYFYGMVSVHVGNDMAKNCSFLFSFVPVIIRIFWWLFFHYTVQLFKN